MRSFELKENNLDTLINEILSHNPKVVLLRGDLAAGKTTLVKAVVKSLGINDEVTSPTFSIQQLYSDKIFHYDLYNHGVEQFLSLGLLEELEKEGYHFIEWGDDTLLQILKSAQIPTLVINIVKCSNETRCYEVNDGYTKS